MANAFTDDWGTKQLACTVSVSLAENYRLFENDICFTPDGELPPLKEPVRGGHRGGGRQAGLDWGGTSPWHPRSATATVRAGNDDWEIDFCQLNSRKYKYINTPPSTPPSYLGFFPSIPPCPPSFLLFPFESPPLSNMLPSLTARESSSPSFVRSAHP